MKKLLMSLTAVAVLTLTSCQAMIYGRASQLNQLQIGMTKDQVIQTLGKPVATYADGDKGEEYLIYKKMKHVISEWPRTFKLTLRDGKLVKWGEQYEEKNINRF